MRLVVLVAVASLSLLAVCAQGELQKESAEGKTQDSKKKLEITLRSLTPVACLGSSLTLEVEITNKGTEDVELNRAYFWNNYSFCPATPNETGQEKECLIYHFWPSSTSEDVFHLAPGMKLVDVRIWPLVDMETGTHIYETRIYGAKKEVQIQVYECGLQTTKEQ